MKTTISTVVLGLLISTTACTQGSKQSTGIEVMTEQVVSETVKSSPEEKAIKKTIKAFAKAGDENKADDLSNYLDANYRIVMNRLFGSADVSVMTREVYLEKIASKEYGGDTRTLSFESIVINGSTACAHVIQTGQKMTFNSLLTLLKDGENNWKIVSDVPVIGETATN